MSDTLCPFCKGTGKAPNPPWVPRDSPSDPCRGCKGSGFIERVALPDTLRTEPGTKVPEPSSTRGSG